MQDHDWNDINIQMICDRADVARSTFYAHFPTKQDLLDSEFSFGLVEIEHLAQSLHGNDLPTLAWLVDHLSQSQGFRRRLQGSGAGHQTDEHALTFVTGVFSPPSTTGSPPTAANRKPPSSNAFTARSPR